MTDKKTTNASYKAHKKYASSHPEVYKKASKIYAASCYRAHLLIPKECKSVLDELATQTGLTINQLFVTAVEEKYGVVLHKKKQLTVLCVNQEIHRHLNRKDDLANIIAQTA